MNFLEKIANSAEKMVLRLENSKLPFVYFVLTFLSAASLRNFLEHFSAHSGLSAEVVLHYSLFYTAIAVCLMLLFWLAVKEKMTKIAKVVLSSFLITSIAPLLDLAFTFGKGQSITYLLPGIHENLLLRFLTFTGSFSGDGISPGLKIEVAVVLAACFAYFWLKSKKLSFGKKLTKSMFFSLAAYALIFCFASVLFFVKWLVETAGMQYEEPLLLLNHLYLVVIFVGSILAACIANKKAFLAIIKEMPLLRLLHFEAMLVLGIAFGLHGNIVFKLQPLPAFSFATAAIAICFACLYSMFSNNIADREIDVAAKRTALAKKEVALKQYEKISWAFFFAALFYGAMASFQTFFVLLLFMGNYFLYSMPPLRLKRIPFASKILVSINSLALVMLGFIFIRGTLADFPLEIIGIFLVGFTAAINFIDLKDAAADKKAKIKTLPAMLGVKKAKFLIGLFFAVTYLSFGLIIKETLALPILAALGALQFFLINRENYSEKPVFLVYLFSITALTAYLISSPL